MLVGSGVGLAVGKAEGREEGIAEGIIEGRLLGSMVKDGAVEGMDITEYLNAPQNAAGRVLGYESFPNWPTVICK